MEAPTRLQDNIAHLLRQMKALKEIRDSAARRNKRGKYDGLIERVQIMETEVAEIRETKQFGSLRERVKLNKRVISSMREIRILLAQFEIDDEPEARIIDDETEARISNLTILLRFSVAQLNSFTFGFSKQVGKGGFGSVYQGQFPTGVQIAVKVIDDNDVSENTFMAELEAIYKCNHQNLIQLYGFCYEKTMKALVYDYMEKGSLDAVLYKNRHNIKWDKLYSIATETAKGIAYLHDGCTRQTIHHDMKPANILLDSRLSPKITDFGLAKIMAKDVTDFTLTRIKGTPGYVAPEISVHYGKKVTSKSDVYSFGMLLFEILRRRRHYENDDDDDSEEWFPEKVWRKFNNGELDEIIEECDIAGEEDIEKARVLSAVALWCVQYTVEVRPSMSVVVYMLENVMQVTAPPNPFLPTYSGDSMRPAHSHVARSTVIPIVTESLHEQKDLKNAEDLIPGNVASYTNWNPSRSKDSVILFTESKYFIDKFQSNHKKLNCEDITKLNCEDETWEVMIQSEQPPLLIVKGKYIGQPITEVTNIENDEKLSPATDQRLNEKRSPDGGNFIHEASISNLERSLSPSHHTLSPPLPSPPPPPPPPSAAATLSHPATTTTPSSSHPTPPPPPPPPPPSSAPLTPLRHHYFRLLYIQENEESIQENEEESKEHSASKELENPK